MRPAALTVALAVGLLAGCGNPTGPEAIAGNYTLRTINGQDLPFTIEAALLDGKIELAAGSLRINSDNTFSLSLTLATTEGGTTTSETETTTGSYTLNETAITLTSDGETVTGSITGNTLTLIDEGLTFVYQK